MVSIVDRLKNENLIPYIDIAVGQYLSDSGLRSDDLFIFYCFLSAATRSGHLCVKVNPLEIEPPVQVLIDNEDVNFKSNDWLEIEQHIKNAALYLKSHPHSHIVRQEDLFYFEKYWNFENDCLTLFDQFMSQKPHIQLDLNLFNKELDFIINNNLLLDSQMTAVNRLNEQSLSIICGGPGTGKTYTAGLIIKTYWNSLKIEDKKNCLIGLTAPTGKACANLQKSIFKQTQDLNDFPLLKTQTLHSLLKVKQPSLNNQLKFDLLLVDESSMIDIKMMSLLIKAVKKGSRLIFLGDTFQLPSVEAGSFFSDLCVIANKQTVFLDKCVRTDLVEIVNFATHIKDGNTLKIQSQIKNSNPYLKWQEIDLTENVTAFKKKLFEQAYTYLKNLDENTINQFCILTPLRRGSFGSTELNAFFYDELKKRSNDSILKIPIIITVNSYKNELYNGDTGILYKHLDSRIADFAVIQGRKIPKVLLPSFEYAYCLSVHKSQGSEFENVVILVPTGSENFGREMLYTAVTRAKKGLTLISTFSTLEKTIKNKTLRLSKTKVAYTALS